MAAAAAPPEAPEHTQPPVEGHVFILLADIMKVACDAWVGASGGYLDPRHHDLFPRGAVAKERCRPDSAVERFVPWPDELNRARPYVAYLNSISRNADFFAAIAEDFVRCAAPAALERGALYRRHVPLIATPILGSGAGGAFHFAGEVVRAMMPRLSRAAAELGVDVAIVTNESELWVAAQVERVRFMGSLEALAERKLPQGLGREAIRLADLAVRGDLALFVGAGISASAGLPMWGSLLRELAASVGVDHGSAEWNELDVYDQARVVQRRLEAAARERRDRRNEEREAAGLDPVGTNEAGLLGSAVAARLRSDVYAPAHAMVAALPVREMITTNYDTMIEAAVHCGQTGPLSVLPHAPVKDSKRWLLKMHGCVTRPSDIVLTRVDYLRFNNQRAALSGIVQSTMLTKSLLYLGFSLSDTNFHSCFDTIRKAQPADGESPAEKNIALMLMSNSLQAELWDGEVQILALGDRGQPISELARLHDIFLDVLGAGCANRGRADFLMQNRFESLLSAEELQFKNAVDALIRAVPRQTRTKLASWHVMEKALVKLGWNGALSEREVRRLRLNAVSPVQAGFLDPPPTARVAADGAGVIFGDDDSSSHGTDETARAVKGIVREVMMPFTRSSAPASRAAADERTVFTAVLQAVRSGMLKLHRAGSGSTEEEARGPTPAAGGTS